MLLLLGPRLLRELLLDPLCFGCPEFARFRGRELLATAFAEETGGFLLLTHICRVVPVRYQGDVKASYRLDLFWRRLVQCGCVSWPGESAEQTHRIPLRPHWRSHAELVRALVHSLEHTPPVKQQETNHPGRGPPASTRPHWRCIRAAASCPTVGSGTSPSGCERVTCWDAALRARAKQAARRAWGDRGCVDRPEFLQWPEAATATTRTDGRGCLIRCASGAPSAWRSVRPSCRPRRRAG